MKIVLSLSTVVLFAAGLMCLGYLTSANQQLAVEISRLEAELGKMSIKDASRVHIVEIKSPEVPPEVASRLLRVWQFRCYMPPGYDYMKMSGSGRITEKGLYQDGGFSSGWGSPSPTASHQLLSISIQKKADQIIAYYSLAGSAGTTSWNGLNADSFPRCVVRKLASSQSGARSFDAKTILPLLKLYDPTTAESAVLDGESVTTYKGAQVILCPKSREPQLEILRRGKTPSEFDPDSIAELVDDE